MKRKIVSFGILLVFIICLFFSLDNPVYADEKDRLDIQVDAGLDGKAKEGQGYPVTLTITNNKEDFNGDLVISLPVVNKVIPIDIAAGTTKTISFSVQDMQEMRNYQPNSNQKKKLFHLYDGDWQDGKEVRLDSNIDDLFPVYIQMDKLVIGVLSDRPDSLNYLKLTSFFGNEPEVINLDESLLPAEAQGLDVIDLLVVNDYSIAALPEQKQQAINEWIQLGGKLVTGSEPGLSQQFGSLAELLPLTINGEEEVQQINGLDHFSKESIESGQIELFKGELDEEATVLHNEKEIPLIIENTFGKGAVIQFTFDLGMSALADWQGNNSLWQSFATHPNNQNPYINDYGMRTVDRLSDFTRMFPALANLKVSTLVLLFVAYLLIVIPILYIVLKRMDRREWAWVIIPVFALVSSIGLYTVGAKDRGGAIKTNVMSVISLDEQGKGSGTGVISMLSKGSGAYTIAMDSAFNPIPHTDIYGPQPSYLDLPVLETEEDASNVHFQQVEFWSPRSVAFEQSGKDFGKIESELSYVNDTISGKVTNNFVHDLQDVYLISGNKYQEIGEMAVGESKEISFAANNKDYFQQPTEQVAYSMFGQPGQFGQQSEEQVKSELLSTAIRNEMDRNVNTPRLIGFSDQSFVPLTVNGDETNQTNHHLVMQPISIHLPDDQTSTLSTELQMPTATVESGQIYHNGMDYGERFIEASAGSYLFTYEIPTTLSERSFRIDELAIRLQNNRNGVTFSLKNTQNDSFETIDTSTTTFSENADEKYLNNNQLVVQVSAASEGTIEVPIIELEGVINP
ncbi:hypothetical protein [Gracilibacillus kekensis]|uniref:Uncharacterized membrane protein n=1 Tax=Gracilibacillus kekensis TaxID=1027249 RepID=A0A1M7JXD8_9BACI|nr:hypothetical protein [Gracilibacillus kekensis]SHM57699.1 Uncharacterized membrane protein [Gracilibacillus kekensis]